MQYLITFLEGLLSFVSPCMLPMLPIYLSYFAGDVHKKRHIVLRVSAFVAGFSIVFCALGLFAGYIGAFLARYGRVVDIVCGIFVVFMGLSFLDIIKLPFLKGMQTDREMNGVFSALVFGMIYSLSLTPCVGAFLGSALMLAGSAGTALQGAALLLCYSLGLGVPFLLSAVILDKLAGTLNFIKGHYKVINLVCGIFLIVVGISMAMGWLGALLRLFT